MKYQQGTVFERMSVAPADFESIKIVAADKDTQAILAKVLLLTNERIRILENILEQTNKLKKYLLNNMFI